MINKKLCLEILVIVLILIICIVGCASSPSSSPNFYNFGDVAEENCAYILVNPSPVVDGGRSDFPTEGIVKINGQGDKTQWRMSSPFLLDLSATPQAVVRVAPGEYTFTVTFIENLSIGGRNSSRTEVPVSINYSVKAGKGYIFYLNTEWHGGNPLTAYTVAEIIVYEIDTEDGNCLPLGFLNKRREVARRTEKINLLR